MNASDACLRLMVCAVLWGLTSAAQDVAAADPDDPRLYPSVPDPNDPQKTRETVSPERREQLGLTPHTWTGVVHPDVYPTLDRLNQTVATLKSRLDEKKGKDIEGFDALQRIRFPGMVYVQVRSKDNDAQRRVLGALNALEFNVQHTFDEVAGFVGYATKDALDKLGDSPDVISVSLDDKPLPGRHRIFVKDKLPPREPGDGSDGQPALPEGNVDPDVYRAFDLADRINVMVSLRADSLPHLTNEPSQMWTQGQLRDCAERRLQDGVLSALNADELVLWGRHGTALSGYVTKEGVQKLRQHPDVLLIKLPSLGRPLERHSGGQFTP